MTDPPKQKKEAEKHNGVMLMPVKRGASPSSSPRQTLTGDAPPKLVGAPPSSSTRQTLTRDALPTGRNLLEAAPQQGHLLVATGLPLSLQNVGQHRILSKRR